MSELRKIRDTIIYQDEMWYCGPGPSPVNLGDSQILVAFRRCSKYAIGHFTPCVEFCTVKSYDGGESWSQKPNLFACGGLANQNLIILSDGTIIGVTVSRQVLHSKYLEGIDQKFVRDGPYGSWASFGAEVYRSNNKGETWEGPYYMANVPGHDPILPGASSPTHIRGKGLVLDDGTLIWPLYTQSGPLLMASSDDGITWEFRAYIVSTSDYLYYNEASVYQCPSGKLIAFIRSDTSDGRGYLHTAVSLDRGFTWSKPKREDVWGYPFDAIKMLSGNVLLTYGYRREPYGIRARLLNSECDNISEADEVVLRDDGSGTDLGYPQSTILSDGTALVTYYYQTKECPTCFIAGTVVAEE